MAPRYTTLAAVKARLDIDDGDTSRDDELEAVIDAAEAAVDSLTKQVWKSPAASMEYFTVDRWTYKLYIPPAQSVTAVAEKDSDGTWTALADEDWAEIERSGPTTQLLRTSGTWKQTVRGEASVRVSGVFASTATAPPDIAMAALILSHRLVNRSQAPFGIEGGGIETGAMYLAQNDPDVYTLLKRHRRYGFGRKAN